LNIKGKCIDEANKPGIIATKCLPHQCIEKEHKHNSVYTTNTINEFNN